MTTTARCILAALLSWLPLACSAGSGARDRPLSADTGASAPAELPLPVLDAGLPKLLPLDADSTFAPFRRRLMGALAQRDTAFLFSILAPEIKNSFGGDDSIAGFKRIWRMHEANTPVWTALTRILTLGGEQQGDYYVTPYVHAAWPDSIDPFEHVAVTSERAVARGAPASDAPAVGTLSYGIVPVEEWQGLDYESGVATAQSWVRVRLPDGRAVWLNGLDVYGPVDWRAMFEKRNGEWRMIILVAGD